MTLKTFALVLTVIAYCNCTGWASTPPGQVTGIRHQQSSDDDLTESWPTVEPEPLVTLVPEHTKQEIPELEFEFTGPTKSPWGASIDTFIESALGLSDDGTWTRIDNETVNKVFEITGKRGSTGVLLNDANGTTWRFTTSESGGQKNVIQVVALEYQKDWKPIDSKTAFLKLLRRYEELLGKPVVSKSGQRIEWGWLSSDHQTSIKIGLPDEKNAWVKKNMPNPYPALTITLAPAAIEADGSASVYPPSASDENEYPTAPNPLAKSKAKATESVFPNWFVKAQAQLYEGMPRAEMMRVLGPPSTEEEYTDKYAVYSTTGRSSISTWKFGQMCFQANIYAGSLSKWTSRNCEYNQRVVNQKCCY